MMQPQTSSRQTWPSGDDNTGFYLVIILGGLCALAYMLWTNFHTEISSGVMALNHLEIAVISYFTDRFALADQQMAATDPSTVTLHDLYGINDAVGQFLRLPAASLVLLLASICMVRAAPARYKRAFDVGGLIREQVQSFPTTAAFGRRHLRLVPPRDWKPDVLKRSDLQSYGLKPDASKPGAPKARHPKAEDPEPDQTSKDRTPRPADYALTPEEWVARFATCADGRFDEASCRQALAGQLGPRWQGLSAASPQVRCLFAVCALHLAERQEEAVRLLGLMATGLVGADDDKPEGPEVPLLLPPGVAAAVDSTLTNHTITGAALAIVERHAYTYVGIMSLLNKSRRHAGVLAPAQFVALKLLDRPFWYALDSLGFETEGAGRYLHPNPRVEAVGARDHWAIEQLCGEPVLEPDLDRALDALRAVASRVPDKAPAAS